jgi:hypothetical protein
MREASITVNRLMMNQTPLVHSVSLLMRAHHRGVSAAVVSRVIRHVLDTSGSGVQENHTDRKGMGTQVCFTDTAPPNYQ